MSLYIYSAAEEVRLFVALELVRVGICWGREVYVTCKAYCILYS